MEKFASRILTKYLGRYVEGLEEKNLQISLMKGSVQLSNLKLRKEALDGLELPITVKTGYLGELELTIPWKNFTFEEASLRIKKVYLEAGPKEEKEEVSGQAKVLATKQKILQLAELVGVDDIYTGESGLDNTPGYFDIITTSILNNIQLFIDDIYIRYVDEDLDFDFGLQCESLHAQSTDFFWKPKVVTQTDMKDKIFYKLVSLTKFSLFWNDYPFKFSSKKRGGGDKKFQHILSPVDVGVHLIINKNELIETSQPKLSIECTLPFIQINFNENQYKELLSIIEKFSNYRKSMNYLHLRPSIGAAKQHPLHWWRYAVDSALFDVKKKNQKLSWVSILKMLQDKKRYILLYAKKKVLEHEKSSLPAEEIKELEDMEYQYDVDLIIHFRNLSSILSKSFKEDRKKKRDELMKKNWFGKMFKAEIIPFETTTLSASIINSLEAQLSSTTTNQPNNTKEHIQYKIDFTLQRSEINIRDHYFAKVMSFTCSYLSFDCLLRSSGGKFSLFIQSFYTNDHFTPETSFPKVLYSEDEGSSEPILQASLDLNPLDKEVDIDLEIMMSKIVMVYPRKLLLRTFQFFALPVFERHSRSLELLAIEKLQEFKTQATQQIKDLFNNAKRIAISLKIPSPKILLPQNIHVPSSPLLIVDLGSITFNNVDTDLSPLNMDSIYSTYVLTNNNVNAYMTTIQNYMKFKNNSNTDVSLVDRFKLIEDFKWESKISVCRFQSPLFPLFRINTEIDNFTSKVSAKALTDLLLIFDDIIMSVQVMEKSIVKVEIIQILPEISNIKTQNFDLSFVVEHTDIKLIDDIGSELPIEILNFQFNHLQSKISQSNHCTSFEYSLSSAYVIDGRKNHLFTSEIGTSEASSTMKQTLTELRGDNNCVISMKYFNFPENSPLFENCKNQLSVEFNSVLFFCEILTIESIAVMIDKVLSDFFQFRNPPNHFPTSSYFKSGELTNSSNTITTTSSQDQKVILNLQVTIRSVGFVVPIDRQPVIESIFGGSELFLLSYPNGDITTNGKIGKVTIDYNEAQQHGFPHVLEIEGDKLVKFEMLKYGAVSKLSSGLDYHFKLDVDSVTFYYFHSMMVLLSNYLDTIISNEFTYKLQQARNMEVEPSPTLIGYEVEVQNPRVVIPAICNNFVEGYALNLGFISIKNKIVPGVVGVEGNDSGLKVEILITINNFFLESYHRPSLNNNFLRDIVDNTNAVIIVHRDIKQIDDGESIWAIKATIPNFTANVSRYHVSVLRHCLATNFLSDATKRLHEKSRKVEKDQSINNNNNNNNSINNSNNSNNNKIEKVAKQLKIYFTCEVLKSSISIHNGDGVQLHAVFSAMDREYLDDSCTSKSVPLLLIQTDKTLFTFVHENDTNVIEIATRHFTMDDIRDVEKKFSHICVPLINNIASKPMVIQSDLDDLFNDKFRLKFVSGKDLPNSFDITIENHFVVVMDAWVDIASLLILIQPEVSRIISHLSLVLDPDEIAVPVPLFATIKFPKPDICIIQDSSSSSSDSILVHGSHTIEFVHNPIHKTTQIKAYLTDVEIFESTMSSSTKLQSLIEKTNFEIVLIQTTNVSDVYSVSITSPFHIHFTFRDYVLLRNLSKMWLPLFKDLLKAHESSLLLSESIDKQIVNKNIEQRFGLSCLEGSITIINDLDVTSQERPLLKFFSESLRLNIINWSSFERKKMEVILDSIFKVDYLNYKLEVWEAMLEQTKVKIDLASSGENPKNITGYIENINVNISCPLIDAVLNTIQAITSFKEDRKIEHSFYYEETTTNAAATSQLSLPSLYTSYAKNSTKNIAPINDEGIEGIIYPFYIRNDTGIKIVYGVTDDPSVQPLIITAINPNIETPLLRKVEKTRNNILKLAEDKDNGTVSFTDRILIDKIGKYRMKIGAKNNFYISTCDISYRKGSKVITLRSNRLFRNSTMHSIYVCLKTLDKDDFIFKIEPNQTSSIPLTHLSQYSEFCVTSNYDSHHFTKHLCFDAKKDLYYLTTVPKSSRGIPHVFIMKYYKQDVDYIFEIFPSIILENALPVAINVTVTDSFLNDYLKRNNPLSYSVNRESLLSLHEIALNVDHDISITVDIPSFGKCLQPITIPVSFLSRSVDKTIEFRDSGGAILSLRCIYTTINHIRKIVLFSSFWIINKTSMNILYKLAGSSDAYLAGQYQQKNLTPSPFLLFSPSNKLLSFQSSNLSLKVDNSSWSDPIVIESEGIVQSVSVIDTSTSPHSQYEFIVAVKNATGIFWRTKEVIISSKLILVNQTLDTLRYCQPSSSPETCNEIKLKANQYTPLHWTDCDAQKELRIKFSSDQEWSSPFRIAIGNFSLKVRNRANSENYLLYSISIFMDSQNTSTIIAVSYQTSPEYLIDNQTIHPFYFSQKFSNYLELVGPNHSTSFTPDFPYDNQVLCLKERDCENVLEIPLESFNFNFSYFEIGNDEGDAIHWSYTLSNEGTKVITLRQFSSPPIIDSTLGFISLHIKNVAVSMIDERPQEIILISLRDIATNLEIEKEEVHADISVGLYQIDNQLPNSPYPVLLHSLRPISKSDHFVHIISSLRIDTKSFLFFNSFQFFIQPFDIRVDEEIIIRLLTYTNAIRSYLEMRRKSILHSEDEFNLIANSTKTTDPTLRLYFNSFKISILDLAVSFKSDAASLDEEFSRLLPSHLRLIANFENAPMKFDELQALRFHAYPFELLDRLSSYYNVSLKTKLYTLLSSDFLGDPKSLVSNISTGFYDFFHEPTYTFIHSPANIGYGLARGTKSLVLNSLYAIGNTTSKLSDSLASGVATASFDSDFQRERDWSKARDKPAHIGAGATQGIISLGKGFFDGVAGVIVEPLKGTQEGTSGVIKGLLKGTTGLIVKPTVGVLDSVSKFSEGLKNNTNIENIVKPIRLPRYIGRDKVLRPYNEEQAQIQYLLQTIKLGKFSKEFLQAYYHISNQEEILMITEKLLLIVENSQLKWESSIRFIKNVSLHDIEITITCNSYQNVLKNIVIKPFFSNPISSEVRKYECQQIYNELTSLLSLLKFNCD